MNNPSRLLFEVQITEEAHGWTGGWEKRDWPQKKAEENLGLS
jgi:hypothetical protein